MSLNLDTTADDLIPTAIINVSNNKNQLVPCRILIDTGSTANFISEELAKNLHLPANKCSMPIGALNDLSTTATSWIPATIKSRVNGLQKTLQFFVVPQISTWTPNRQIDRSSLKIPPNLELADPEFYKPAPIQMLLGSGMTFSLLSVGQIKLSNPGEPDLYLQKTLLGWVCGGSLQLGPANQMAKCHLVQLMNDIQRFWEIEELNTKPFSKEEAKCEEHFVNHVTRNKEGRYIVALPFNHKKDELGTSMFQATNRFLGLERRLKRDPVLYQQYQAVMQEYLDLGHMKKCENAIEEGFFLPHHAVVKDSSSTTKLRVVFDGSAPSSTKVTLNDTLMNGPTIQDDIFTLILRFRTYNYVFTGDIEKMYRQIRVRPEDWKYQRILWRDERGEICVYELQTVTFGLTPAPYLAIRCLHQLADDEGSRFPLASRILKRDLYVDDLLTGAQTLEEAIALRDEIIQLLKLGGFNLRQCASNSPSVIQDLPDIKINKKLLDGDDTTLKTLGVRWEPQRDEIIYSVNPISTLGATMRIMSAEIARIFDPLGLLNPVVMHAKLIKQELWRLKLDWDETVPLTIQNQCQQFISELPLLNNQAFNRKIVAQNSQEIQLHGFCDASAKGYGACVYLRTTSAKGKMSSELFCAKSRVAPLKTIQTIPRLELCSALLLAQLYGAIKEAIDVTIDRTVFWTDSTVALHWIRTDHKLLNVFVANRVSQIQEKTNPSDWRHVRTHENPADAISRGQLPTKFLKNVMWRNGPDWLTKPEDEWPILELNFPSELPEGRKKTCLVTIGPSDHSILQRYSSFERLVRIVARCLRIVPRYRVGNPTSALTVRELQTATTCILKMTQSPHYSREIDHLKKEKPLPSTSPLLLLNPFVDQSGIIRVRGRLKNSDLPFNQQHPIILSKGHHVTKLIIEKQHRENLHAGTQATLYGVRQRYWPIDGRNQIRHVIKSCVTCIQARPPQTEYLMGDLPRDRITQTRPFQNVGIDYCGPFFLKEKRHRNRGRIKAYLAVFICMAVKAVHIEVVSDMSTDAFLASLRRFISRRGKCISIYSDNGSNFVGANHQLLELQELFNSKTHQDQVQKHLASKGIKWHFNPPAAPHTGGLWEAAVKSMKHHLKRVVGEELLTFEDFNTLVIEIEAILNSRPLTPISADPNDLVPLTPAHFLIGTTFTSLPEPDFQETPTNRLSTWQHVQKVKQHFWNRWHKEYLNELHRRNKWPKRGYQMRIGSVVIVKEDNTPPSTWKIGRVVAVHPGRDDVVRTATVKTNTGVYLRNVKKLAILLPD